MEASQQSRQVQGARRQHRAEHDRALLQPGERGQVGADRVRSGQDLAGAFEHDGPGLGQHDAAAGSAQQRKAELRLQLADGVGDRGLREVELLGAARERSRLRDLDEGAQLTELHLTIVWEPSSIDIACAEGCPYGRQMQLTATDILSDQRAAFDVPPEIAYFNTANLSPQLHSVRAAGEAALELRSRPWTIDAPDWFTDVERLRALFGRVVGAEPDGVALVPATSYGFAVAAANLPVRPGQRIPRARQEYLGDLHVAGRRTALRRRTVTVSREPGQAWADAVLAVLDERVAIVSVPNVHWTDGAFVDLAAIAARSRALGARLVIDGSQSVGALPLDVGDLRPDFLVTVGYKWLLGPFGVGYLYVADEHRDGEPLEQNWILRAGSEDFARLVDYRDEYQPGARRFDVGQRTKFELTPMAIAALEQVLDWQARESRLPSPRAPRRSRGRATRLGLAPVADDARGPHMLGVRVPESCHRVSPALEAEHCYAPIRAASLRIAPHLHTTDKDIERLDRALARVMAGARP